MPATLKARCMIIASFSLTIDGTVCPIMAIDSTDALGGQQITSKFTHVYSIISLVMEATANSSRLLISKPLLRRYRPFKFSVFVVIVGCFACMTRVAQFTSGGLFYSSTYAVLHSVS